MSTPDSRSRATVLFACVHNAGRSQMAAAFFNQLVRPGAARAMSAGTSPAACVHPAVVTVMHERGIDLSGAVPARLTPTLAAGVRWLITLGCGEQCPFVPGAEVLDWPVPDPRDRSIDEVRGIRDDLERRVAEFIDTHAWR